MEKKYRLRKEDCIVENEHTLYRIVAVRDFGSIESGTIGGYVEKEKNLSHTGNSWIYGKAKVYGNAVVNGDSEVIHEAVVCDNAKIKEKATIGGNSYVGGSAVVSGETMIGDKAMVVGNAKICGKTRISGSGVLILGEVIIKDSVILEKAIIKGGNLDDVFINGNVEVSGSKTKISGLVKLYGKSKIIDSILENTSNLEPIIVRGESCIIGQTINEPEEIEFTLYE